MGTEGTSTVRSCVAEYPCWISFLRFTRFRSLCLFYPIRYRSFWFVLVRSGSLWFVGGSFWFVLVRSGSLWFVASSDTDPAPNQTEPARTSQNQTRTRPEPERTTDEPERTRTNHRRTRTNQNEPPTNQNEPERTTDEPERTRTNRIEQTNRVNPGESDKTAWTSGHGPCMGTPLRMSGPWRCPQSPFGSYTEPQSNPHGAWGDRVGNRE